MYIGCCIILIWSVGNIFSSVSYSDWSILPDYNADICAASPLILCCSFHFWSYDHFAMNSFYILFKRFFKKHNGLSDAREVSVTKTECGSAVHFLKIHKVFIVYI